MTVKAVWHIVKESVRNAGVARLASHDLRPVLGSATRREASWSRSNFFWGTFQCRRPNATLAASSGFVQRSTIALASSRTLDVVAPVVEGLPTVHRAYGALLPDKDRFYFRLPYAFRSTATSAYDGRLVDANIKTIGSGHRCIGRTADPSILNFYLDCSLGTPRSKGLASAT